MKCPIFHKSVLLSKEGNICSIFELLVIEESISQVQEIGKELIMTELSPNLEIEQIILYLKSVRLQ
jgi:hypothetical protein